MSNVNYVDPPYFGFLREMIRRAEHHADGRDWQVREDQERGTTNSLYEIEALTNIIGELECSRAECERRIRYLQDAVAEDV